MTTNTNNWEEEFDRDFSEVVNSTYWWRECAKIKSFIRDLIHRREEAAAAAAVEKTDLEWEVACGYNVEPDVYTRILKAVQAQRAPNPTQSDTTKTKKSS